MAITGWKFSHHGWKEQRCRFFFNFEEMWIYKFSLSESASIEGPKCFHTCCALCGTKILQQGKAGLDGTDHDKQKKTETVLEILRHKLSVTQRAFVFAQDAANLPLCSFSTASPESLSSHSRGSRDVKALQESLQEFSGDKTQEAERDITRSLQRYEHTTRLLSLPRTKQ